MNQVERTEKNVGDDTTMMSNCLSRGVLNAALDSDYLLRTLQGFKAN